MAIDNGAVVIADPCFVKGRKPAKELDVFIVLA